METHAELLAKSPIAREQARRYASDPEYRRQVDEVEEKRRKRINAFDLASQPVLQDLKELGINVPDLWSEILNMDDNIDTAAPLFIAHIRGNTLPNDVLQALASRLATKNGGKYWDEIKNLYLTSTNAVVEETLAGTLATIARKRNYHDLVSFVEDEKLGPNRLLFLRPIFRYGGAEGKQLVISLRDHPQMYKQATYLTRKLIKSRPAYY
ncbi:MAG: hypothetical protein LBH13_03140 [Cellulomonadaceae bacterium]|nr:hypothetical protein [Cellulomonadaceae bacterium]